MWNEAVQKYIIFMEKRYTNWNSGRTKDGSKKTYDYTFDRRKTVAYADMETMIDNGLSSGEHSEIDDIYVKLVMGPNRHTLHSGPNGNPSKKDTCAIAEKVIDKKKTKERQLLIAKDKNKKKARKEITKLVYRCKRRKPQPKRSTSGIYRDPYKKKFKQFSTASNDGFFNGGCPFATLFHLHNIDDKGIPPAWLTKPPKFNWNVNNEKLSATLTIHSDNNSELAGEYMLKYSLKTYSKKMTDRDSLIIAAEPLMPENNITTGTITRACNQTCQSNLESIFQATHKNWNLPLVSSNVEPKSCSLTDISILRKAPNTDSTEDVPELEGIEYVLPKPMEKFNRRLDEDVFHPNISSSDFKEEIPLR